MSTSPDKPQFQLLEPDTLILHRGMIQLFHKGLGSMVLELSDTMPLLAIYVLYSIDQKLGMLL